MKAPQVSSPPVFSSERLLSAGSFSKIKLVKQSNTELVLKEYLTKANPSHLTFYLKELSTIKHISHPNIIQFISSFSTDSSHCLLLEYCEGGDLHDFILTNHPFGMPEAIGKRLFKQIVNAVNHIHSLSFVHRDIKLENVLLTANMTVKLADFGFAERTNSPLTTFIGSDEYLAPEIIKKEHYDGKLADSWACGIVFYGMLTGHLPFSCQMDDMDVSMEDAMSVVRSTYPPVRRTLKTRRKMFYSICAGEYRWPSKSQVSKSVKELIDGMLQVFPKRRLGLGGVIKHISMKGEKKE